MRLSNTATPFYYGKFRNSGDDVLTHYGIPKRSGRYPWGSGEDPDPASPRGKAMDKDESKPYAFLDDTPISKLDYGLLKLGSYASRILLGEKVSVSKDKDNNVLINLTNKPNLRMKSMKDLHEELIARQEKLLASDPIKKFELDNKDKIVKREIEYNSGFYFPEYYMKNSQILFYHPKTKKIMRDMNYDWNVKTGEKIRRKNILGMTSKYRWLSDTLK